MKCSAVTSRSGNLVQITYQVSEDKHVGYTCVDAISACIERGK